MTASKPGIINPNVTLRSDDNGRAPEVAAASSSHGSMLRSNGTNGGRNRAQALDENHTGQAVDIEQRFAMPHHIDPIEPAFEGGIDPCQSTIPTECYEQTGVCHLGNVDLGGELMPTYQCCFFDENEKTVRTEVLGARDYVDACREARSIMTRVGRFSGYELRAEGRKVGEYRPVKAAQNSVTH